MARPKIKLTDEQKTQVIDAWNNVDPANNHKIDFVAKKLNVTWQTARRWLILAKCIKADEINDRLDRPGLKWPAWKVTIVEYVDEMCVEIVEAPSWAIAMEMVATQLSIDVWDTACVERVDDTPTPGFNRQAVKEKLRDKLTPDEVQKLIMHYASLGVVR